MLKVSTIIKETEYTCGGEEAAVVKRLNDLELLEYIKEQASPIPNYLPLPLDLNRTLREPTTQL